MSPRPRNAPAVLPAGLFEDGDFLGSSTSRPDLVYWLLNVGDGDLQLILLPERESDHRRAIVVDVGEVGEAPAASRQPEGARLPEGARRRPALPARHRDAPARRPHLRDARVPPALGHAAREHWRPGYWHTSLAYQNTMHLLEDADPHIQHTQPTERHNALHRTGEDHRAFTGCRPPSRFDTYGVDLNDASISLRLEFPASRVEKRDRDRAYVALWQERTDPARSRLAHGLMGERAGRLPRAASAERPPPPRRSGSAQGPDALDAEIFKVPHHASKHGLNLGLVEAVSPRISLISSVGSGGRTTSRIWSRSEALPEGIERIASSGEAHKPDWELKIHYTAEEDPDGPLGSMALVRPPKGREVGLWRFRRQAGRADRPGEGAPLRGRNSGLIGLAHTAMNLEPPGGLRI